MEAAPWSMTDEGEWVLNEPYKSKVWELRLAATAAFNETLCTQLAECTGYTRKELFDEYVRRCNEREDAPTDKVQGLIVEAMCGQLYR